MPTSGGGTGSGSSQTGPLGWNPSRRKMRQQWAVRFAGSQAGLPPTGMSAVIIRSPRPVRCRGGQAVFVLGGRTGASQGASASPNVGPLGWNLTRRHQRQVWTRGVAGASPGLPATGMSAPRRPEDEISPYRRPRADRPILTARIGAIRRMGDRFCRSPHQVRHTAPTGFGLDFGPSSQAGRPAFGVSIGRRETVHGRRPIALERPRLDTGFPASFRPAAIRAGAGGGKSDHRAQAGRLDLLCSIRGRRNPGGPGVPSDHHANSQARQVNANHRENLVSVPRWTAGSAAHAAVAPADRPPRR